ncbi:hypothetical protein [Pontixanthobacter sp. CEM42]|uniref:hypothetical protein n=1 Tax=Pontixanthobacter sp. CEM42 TaxID=2792077 RepID=UPI001AE023FD|nr:hypothetical protein [Pontixanthobacter sp. CEM42]
MDISANRAAKLSAVLLIVTVVTQIIYFAISSGGGTPPRMIIWTTEAVVFLGLSVLALVTLARQLGNAAAWAALAVGGTLNVIQVGMGLAMFGPLKEAGEAMAPAFDAVLAGAFFLYFAGKFAFGFAGIVLGAVLLRGTGAAKAVGGLAILSGIAALLTNLLGMAKGMGDENVILLSAGAAGTAATLLLALAILMSKSDAEA